MKVFLPAAVQNAITIKVVCGMLVFLRNKNNNEN